MWQRNLNIEKEEFLSWQSLLHFIQEQMKTISAVHIAISQLAIRKKLTKKSNIFTERTILPHKPVEHVETALEVLTLSMSEKGKVDMEYMQNLTEMTKEELASELKGKIYPVPTREEYQTASEYLSGDIYK